MSTPGAQGNEQRGRARAQLADRGRRDAGKPMRPLAVRKESGTWQVVDLGGRAGVIAGSISMPVWVTTPICTVCCHPTAVVLAAAIAEAYRRNIPSVLLGQVQCVAARPCEKRT